METYAYGFPRLGKQREFKKTVENFWDKKISEQELFSRIKEIELQIIDTYKKYVDYYPSFEMTLYDNMLDTALMLGIYEFKDIYNYFPILLEVSLFLNFLKGIKKKILKSCLLN